MSKTKLLFDIEQLLTSTGNETGICRASLEILKCLSKNNNYLIFPIVTTTRGMPPEKYLKSKDLESLVPNIIKMPYLKKTTQQYNIYKKLRCWFLTRRYRKEYLGLLNQYDEYFSVFSPISPIVYESKVKTKLMIHDLIPLIMPPVSTPSFVKKFRSWIQQVNADEVVFDSKSTLNDFLRFRPDYKDKNTKVAYLAAGENFRPTKSDYIKDKYHIQTSKYFLAVSDHNPRKNSIHILDAFFALLNKTNATDISLVLAGPKRSDCDNITAEIKMHPQYADKVICTGYVADKDMPALYSGAEAFLYPSLYEGFGLPIVEAMKCGTPVITCKNSSLPEVGGDAVLYTSETNTEEMVNLMMDLYQNPQKKEQLSRKGIQHAAQFTWEATTAQIFDLK